MMKTRLIAMAMASLVLFYTGCSEKEVPQPTEDTQRTDALRQELRELMVKLHGVQTSNALLKAEEANLTTNADTLEAMVTALQAQYNTSVSYQVSPVDFNGHTISGASVTLNQNGTITTATSDANGIATFTGVKSGYIVAVVKATGYATANFGTSLFNTKEGRATTKVPLLPKSAAALALNGSITIQGSLYANLNVANDTAGTFHRVLNPYCCWGPATDIDSKAGTDEATKDSGPYSWAPHRTYDKVTTKFTLSPDISLSEIPGSAYYIGGWVAGTIETLTYEDAAYVATFDADKQFTFVIPIQGLGSDGVSIDFNFNAEEFASDVIRVSNANTFEDGAPFSVDNPVIQTYTEKRIFRFDDLYNESSIENNYDFTTSETGWTFFYKEGAVD